MDKARFGQSQVRVMTGSIFPHHRVARPVVVVLVVTFWATCCRRSCCRRSLLGPVSADEYDEKNDIPAACSARARAVVALMSLTYLTTVSLANGNAGASLSQIAPVRNSSRTEASNAVTTASSVAMPGDKTTRIPVTQVSAEAKRRP